MHPAKQKSLNESGAVPHPAAADSAARQPPRRTEAENPQAPNAPFAKAGDLGGKAGGAARYLSSWSCGVLVVDDEPSLLHVLTKAVRAMGCTVYSAQDGIQAVDVFRQHPGEIGLVVCDVTMPFMDGWQTLAALRQLVPGIPAILSSGYTDALVMGANRSEQPQAFLSKPYELKDLLEAMDQALRDRQAATVSRDPPSAGRTQ